MGLPMCAPVSAIEMIGRTANERADLEDGDGACRVQNGDDPVSAP